MTSKELQLTACYFSRLTVSYRGVVFVRHQPNLTPALLNRLATKLGELSGKPTSSKLHIHPLSKEFSELGEFKGEKIDSEADDMGRQISFKSEKSNFASVGWVSSFTYFDYLSFFFPPFSSVLSCPRSSLHPNLSLLLGLWWDGHASCSVFSSTLPYGFSTFQSHSASLFQKLPKLPRHNMLTGSLSYLHSIVISPAHRHLLRARPSRLFDAPTPNNSQIRW